MENLSINITNSSIQNSSSKLFQAILTSRKPIYQTNSSRPGTKPLLSRSKCDSSMLSLSKFDDSRLKQSQEARKRYSSLNILPTITATSWCIMESSSSHWISGHNDTEVREIASLTKIMTCIVCLNILKRTESLSIDSQVKVSYRASNTSGTSAMLKSGDRLSIKSLLFGLMLPSGNDAAWALAEYFGNKLCQSTFKPVKHFTAEMNKMAREICLNSTDFENPHGLMYKKNVSCARDVAKLACFSMKNEVFREIVDTRIYTAEVKGADGVIRFQTWENTNKLLGNGFNGVKTGVTDNAGPCLCVSIRKQNPIVIVLLNSRSMDDRWVEAKRLSDWVNGRYY